MKRVTILLLLAALLSCKKAEPAQVARTTDSGVPTDALPPSAVAERMRTPSPPPPPGAAGIQSFSYAAHVSKPSPAAQKMPRLIVRTAEVRVIVSDTAAVARSLSAAAEAAGGYVGDSRAWREGDQLRGTLTLRVPSERLGEILAAARKLAVRVESESINSEDVSQEYVDLSAQLKNQEAAENELRTLMTDVRQKTKRASDVIEMYQQLATVRGDVEKTKGRILYLEQTSAMSTVKLELIPDAVARPVVVPGWQPLVVVKDAGRALVSTGQVVVTAAIWCLVYLLPLGLMFVVPVLLIVWIVRATKRRGITAG